MIFAKNQDLILLPLKCNPPRFQLNRQELAQNPTYISEGCRNKRRVDMCISGGLLFMWVVVHGFRFRVLVAASQKTWFWHSEYEKALFMGRNENRPS
jgi:hypothetical protein